MSDPASLECPVYTPRRSLPAAASPRWAGRRSPHCGHSGQFRFTPESLRLCHKDCGHETSRLTFPPETPSCSTSRSLWRSDSIDLTSAAKRPYNGQRARRPAIRHREEPTLLRQSSSRYSCRSVVTKMLEHPLVYASFANRSETDKYAKGATATPHTLTDESRSRGCAHVRPLRGSRNARRS